MSAAAVFPKPGNATHRIGARELASGLPQELQREAIPFSRTCRQSAVIAEVIFAQSSREKALFAANERAAVALGGAEFNQSAVYEVTDFY
jgi:hypothetical protein